jgi:hypothetical protein
VTFNQMMLPVLLEALELKRAGGGVPLGKFLLALAVPSLACWLCM